MNYTVEMGSDAVIYMPNFIKTGSAIQKFIAGYTNIETHRRRGDCISLLSFFKIRKVG
jgi:hypothetical protein